MNSTIKLIFIKIIVFTIIGCGIKEVTSKNNNFFRVIKNDTRFDVNILVYQNETEVYSKQILKNDSIIIQGFCYNGMTEGCTIGWEDETVTHALLLFEPEKKSLKYPKRIYGCTSTDYLKTILINDHDIYKTQSSDKDNFCGYKRESRNDSTFIYFTIDSTDYKKATAL